MSRLSLCADVRRASIRRVVEARALHAYDARTTAAHPLLPILTHASEANGSLPTAVAGIVKRGQAIQRLLTSSVRTLKLFSVLGPNVLLMATSDASRPRAINTRPIRGVLLRASKVYQWPSR